MASGTSHETCPGQNDMAKSESLFLSRARLLPGPIQSRASMSKHKFFMIWVFSLNSRMIWILKQPISYIHVTGMPTCLCSTLALRTVCHVVQARARRSRSRPQDRVSQLTPHVPAWIWCSWGHQMQSCSVLDSACLFTGAQSEIVVGFCFSSRRYHKHRIQLLSCSSQVIASCAE